MVNAEQAKFSRLRTFLWPVHRSELKKIIPMLFIFFLVNFDYNILRVMKDTVVVTGQGAGAEALPFVKLWMVLPASLVMTFLFTRLANRYSQEKVFYIMVSFFLFYYLIFAIFLYPQQEALLANRLGAFLTEHLPAGCKGFVAMVQNWVISSFYVMSELWSNIVLAMLFWGFANQITHMSQAKRFYGIFGIGANISGAAAAQASIFFSRHAFNPEIPFGSTAWEQSMDMVLFVVIGVGIMAMLLFRWMNTRVLTDPQHYQPEYSQNDKKEKMRLSMRDTFSLLLKSRYLLCIAAIVLCYNLVIHLTEVMWKHEVRELYPDPQEFNIYMNQVSNAIALVATFAAMFISGNSIRKFGWTFTAMLSPAILLITSIGFFFFFFVKNSPSDSIVSLLGTSPLAMVVFFGSAQNCLCRAAKYSVFDSTKEMAYVPLSAESKLKGKAVIDGIGSRLGKSGGSVLYQVLLVMLSSISAISPYIAVCLFAAIFVWILAVRRLGKQMNELMENPEAAKAVSVEGEGTPKQEPGLLQPTF
jgi:AAA family ATP:ADP antiporter